MRRRLLGAAGDSYYCWGCNVSANDLSVQDDRFPEGFIDAISYANEMEEAAAALYLRVFGYETDGSDTGTDLLRAVAAQLEAGHGHD